MLVGIGESASVAMGKSLVPEDALGVSGHVLDAEDFVCMGSAWSSDSVTACMFRFMNWSGGSFAVASEAASNVSAES